MKYTVVVQPAAEAEIEAAYLYLAAEASPEIAISWFNALDAAVGTLTELPRRCPMAPEDRSFEAEIRNLMIPPYRVLFTLTTKEVHLLHIRHMSRRQMQEVDEE